MNIYSFQDCTVSLQNHILSAKNSLISRQWDLSKGLPRAISLQNTQSAYEWIAPDVAEKAAVHTSFYNYLFENYEESTPQIIFNATTQNDEYVEASHVCASITFIYPKAQLRLTIRMYPNMPIIRMGYEVKGNKPLPVVSEENNFEEFLFQKNKSAGELDFLDLIAIKEQHIKWKSVHLRAISDYHDNKVSEDFGLLHKNERRFLKGNLFFCQQVLGDEGIILIKEAPTPEEQVRYPGGDFYLKQGCVMVTGSGVSPTGDDFIPLYGTTICVYQGDELVQLKTLHDYHETRHKFNVDSDAMVLANTWGDRSMDSKMSEQFILDELDVAKNIGISHVQLDMGWQLPSPDPEKNKWLWQFRETFPNELTVIAKRANELDIRLGIWFRPNSRDDFEEWHTDADVLLDLFHRFGITQFKIDGFRCETMKGYQNLTKFMHRTIQESNGQVAFNTDITANKRTGYFGSAQFGTFFVENRYSDWHNYFPHHTLRTLWQLCTYIPSYRLQMEFLNVERNQELYANDPLSPFSAGLAYAFACVAASNPLAWFETTGLSEKSKDILTQLLPVYRTHQADFLKGLILPIGEEPDGTTWSGFHSISQNHGYVLMLHGLNNIAQFDVKLWENVDGTVFTPIFTSKDFNLMSVKHDIVRFESTNPFGYGLYHYQKSSV